MWFSKNRTQPKERFFAWSDKEHSVGVAIFDVEHKHLTELMGKVHATLMEEHDRVRARQLMEELIQETRNHFIHEEGALAAAGYPELEAHAAEHAALLAQAQDLLRQFRAGGLSALAFPIFLKNWLIPHIQGVDRKYASILRRQGLR
jgi:hemerythrin-like metal-binding protein